MSDEMNEHTWEWGDVFTYGTPGEAPAPKRATFGVVDEKGVALDGWLDGIQASTENDRDYVRLTEDEMATMKFVVNKFEFKYHWDAEHGPIELYAAEDYLVFEGLDTDYYIRKDAKPIPARAAGVKYQNLFAATEASRNTILARHAAEQVSDDVDLIAWVGHEAGYPYVNFSIYTYPPGSENHDEAFLIGSFRAHEDLLPALLAEMGLEGATEYRCTAELEADFADQVQFVTGWPLRHI